MLALATRRASLAVLVAVTYLEDGDGERGDGRLQDVVCRRELRNPKRPRPANSSGGISCAHGLSSLHFLMRASTLKEVGPSIGCPASFCWPRQISLSIPSLLRLFVLVIDLVSLKCHSLPPSVSADTATMIIYKVRFALLGPWLYSEHLRALARRCIGERTLTTAGNRTSSPAMSSSRTPTT